MKWWFSQQDDSEDSEVNHYHDMEDSEDSEDGNGDEDEDDSGMRWYSDPYSTPPTINYPQPLAQPSLNNGTGLFFSQAERNRVLQR